MPQRPVATPQAQARGAPPLRMIDADMLRDAAAARAAAAEAAKAVEAATANLTAKTSGG